MKPVYQKQKEALEKIKGYSSVMELYTELVLDGWNLVIRDGNVHRPRLKDEDYDLLIEGIKSRAEEVVALIEMEFNL